MSSIFVKGIEYAIPGASETNDDLQREFPDWRMSEVYSKSGIWSRPIAKTSETASDLSCIAALDLFEKQPGAKDEVDYILNCTQSPDYPIPTTACILQDRLGLGTSIGALDFNLGCSGYIYGLQLATALIGTRQAESVLLLTGDTYSKYINRQDRTVRSLFGDGAAATLVSATGTEPMFELGNFAVGTDGRGAGSLIVPSGGHRTPKGPETSTEFQDAAGCTRSQENLAMDGPAIFAFVLSAIPKFLNEFLANEGLKVDDIDHFVFHQANKMMLENLARACRIPLSKVVIDVHDLGNLVSASIPVALKRSAESGRFLSGDRIVLCGFGVGLSWGACICSWK